MRQAFREFEGHQTFAVIRGAPTTGTGGLFSRNDYRVLGVRQSIFPADLRDSLYDLFGKLRQWLVEANLFDRHRIAREWQPLAAARHDFVVIDEVRDITTVQLALVLKTLRKPAHFPLCGDSNQIVQANLVSRSHPSSAPRKRRLRGPGDSRRPPSAAAQ